MHASAQANRFVVTTEQQVFGEKRLVASDSAKTLRHQGSVLTRLRGRRLRAMAAHLRSWTVRGGYKAPTVRLNSQNTYASAWLGAQVRRPTPSAVVSGKHPRKNRIDMLEVVVQIKKSPQSLFP